jgi:predicted DsbA family dithiol-disulfide isomerase
MKIDITYDFVCPWCYLAVQTLEQALADKPNVEIALSPFQLTPEIPVGGVDHDAFFAARVGPAQATARFRQMEALAAEAAVPLDYASISVLPNTLLAHRAVQFAQGEGKGLQLLNALMAAHFTGRKIGEVDEIVEIAGDLELGEERLREYLSDIQTERHVRRLVGRALMSGAGGVPRFFIDGVATAGGRTLDQWRELL